MSKRLDQEREKILTPKRKEYAIKKLQEKGIDEIVCFEDKRIEFYRVGNKKVVLFPYSGWWSGKGIGSGRGIEKLLKLL